MNHSKTFIFSIALVACGLASTGLAQLERPLKPNEVNVLVTNVKKNPENLKSRLFLGAHFYNKNQWSKVIAFLSPVAEQLPDADLFKLSSSYLNIHDFRQSEAIINILLSKDRVNTPHYLLAIEIYSKILEKLDNPEQRKPVHEKLFDTLKIAQKTDPMNSKIYDVWLEKVEAHVTHYAFEALRVMDDMRKNEIKFRPRHASMLCKFNYLAKFTKETKITCKQAIIQDPNNPSNFIYLGQTHVDIGEDKVGKRMLASVGEKFSKSEEALWATADSYYQSKNVSAAYTFFKKASFHKDAKPRDHLGLANTSFELKKYGEALNAFIKHCRAKGLFGNDFRRATGLLKKQPQWHRLYRQKMMDCMPQASQSK